MSEVIASGTDRIGGPRDFSYVVDWKAEDWCMHFGAYLICAMPCDGDAGGPSFQRRGGGSMDWTEDISEAEPSLNGWIKSDGCSDIEFEVDGTHFCGATSFIDHIKLMAWIHNKAAEVIPRWSDDRIKLDVSVVRGKP